MQPFKNRLASLLRKTEKYTKTDMVYLTSGGFWLGIGQAVATSSAFLLAIAFANLLTPEAYGTYKFVLSAVGILTIPTLAGINAALAQAIPRGIEKIFLRGLLVKIRWGIAGTLGSIILALYYYINGNEFLAAAFLIAAPFIPLFESFGIYTGYLQGKLLFKQSSIYYVVFRIFYVAMLILAAILSDNILLILFVYFFSQTIVNAFFLWRTLKTAPPNNTDEQGVIRYGKHLSLIGIAGKISSNLDALLLFHYLGPIQVAQYAFAKAPIDQITSTYKNFPLLALPKLSNRSIPEMSFLFRARIIQLTLLGTILAIVYVYAAPFIFDFLFPKYVGAIQFSQALALLIVLQMPLTFIATVIQSRLHTTPPSWLYWRSIPQFIYIGLLIFLIPLYGIYGAIIGSVILAMMRFFALFIQWRMFLEKQKSPTA